MINLSREIYLSLVIIGLPILLTYTAQDMLSNRSLRKLVTDAVQIHDLHAIKFY